MNNENFKYLGSVKVIPEDFTVIGYAYSEPLEYGDSEVVLELEDDIGGLKGEVINMVHNGGKCNHCNKSIKYILVVRNDKTGLFYTFGSTCGTDLDNFKSSKISGFKKKNLLARKKLKNIKDRKEKSILGEKFMDDNNLREPLEGTNIIIVGLKKNLLKYGTLSEKQVELAHKIFNDSKGVSPLVEGRLRKVEMTIVSVKERIINTYHGGEEKKVAITLTHPDGWKIWGQLGNLDLLDLSEGDKIIFSGTVSGSKDINFGFFKRGIYHV